MAGDTDDVTRNDQIKARISKRLTPPSPSANTNNDSSTTILFSNSPSNHPPQTSDPSLKGSHFDSQPMTKTSSNSSIPSVTGNTITDAAGPSPYGTRSRNRTGNARPNYAEDRELDAEYEWGSGKKSQAGTGSANSGQVLTGGNDKPIGVSTRRSSTTNSGSTASKLANANGPKDGIPGMSSFPLNPEPVVTTHPVPSKKRKNPGSGAPQSTSLPTSGGSTSQSTSRRAASAAALSSFRETNMLSFENCKGYLKNGKLKADDGTVLGINDHVYLICEPPGEPYYLARIMEFLHSKNSQGQKNDHSLPIEFLRVNWYYRPRDIQRKVNDTRVVFASMHSDTCPLTSLRGKCRILHRNDIADIDDYRKTKDCFWYDRMFDRYIHRYYEVIPTIQVINVPAKVKKVLDDRWKFVIVEQGRGKELTSAIKTCRRCVGYCASNDSVDCAMCKNTYHMNCVRPPLLKKPARGFAWSCGPCSRKQERKLEARNTPLVSEKAIEGDDEELLDEEEEEHGSMSNAVNGDGSRDLGLQNSGPRPATAEQIAQAKLWPYRYLGIHCRVEDALDYDDRIYPRASSRLGPKHQANVHIWHGRPVELVKPADIKKKYVKPGSHKKDAKLTKETIAAIEAEKSTREKRPKWVMDEPPGYVHRGEDHADGDSLVTAKLQFRLPRVGDISSRGNDDLGSSTERFDQWEVIIDDYMAKAKSLAKLVGVPEYSTNFLDKALELLCANNYAIEPALEQLRNVSRRKDLKEPELTKEELKRFEEGVAKYGSELRNVSRHVGKPQKHGEIVRFYYMWKKTDRGKQIWGHYEGRKGKKQSKHVDSKLVDDVADDIDDSAFDNGKAAARKRGFECKFCASRKSPQWRRAPATAPGTTVPADPHSKSNKDKGLHLMLALCQRCAGLWRKYGIQWENIDEVAKKVANGGGRAWKRKIDEELLIELVSANEAHSIGMNTVTTAAAASVGVEIPSGLTIHPGQDGPKKKQKTGSENQLPPASSNNAVELPKKKISEKPPEPALVPEPPRFKVLPCAVCNQMEPTGDQHVVCRHCRLTVHRNCYGVAEGRSGSKWTCDTCANDSTSQVSTTYECVLCYVPYPEQELMEPPRVSHKKKSDREREKERLEREMVAEAIRAHRRKQTEQGRPYEPREPLKRTAGNNWVHVVCALWIPELRFATAELLESIEGIGSIPSAKYGQICKLCKTSKGVCVSCHQCSAVFHVTCAQQYGYLMGFELAAVKGSRKDNLNTVTLGNETGVMSAVIFCREHSVKSTIHPMHKSVEDSPLNALQLFARNYKQVDLTTTGTVRKAALIHSSTRGVTHATNIGAYPRSSTTTGGTSTATSSSTAPITRSSRVSPTAVTVKSEEVDGDGDRVVHLRSTGVLEPVTKNCTMCGTDTSPKWHKAEPRITDKNPSPPIHLMAAAQMAIEFTESQQQQQQQPLLNSNSHTNGDTALKPENTANSVSRPHSEGLMGSLGNNAVDTDCVGGAAKLNGEVAANTISAEPDVKPNQSEVPAMAFVCHKCHLRKLRNPTPRQSTSSPKAVQLVQEEVVSQESPPSVAHSVWPAVGSMTAHDPHQGWSNQPAPRYSGRPRIPNGVSHSPPAAPPPLQPPFIGHAAPYHVGGFPHQHHESQMQHLANGVPSPYQRPRNHVGHIVSSAYASHPIPPSHVGRVSHHAQHSPPMRSPPMHDHNIQGPHGPPRAAENPFAIPYQSHTPPRQQFQGIYGSPLESLERPETPPGGIGRNGVWPSGDGQMTNGASLSPSLRNLIH